MSRNYSLQLNVTPDELTCRAANSLTCRTRKLKCDEQKPQCSQCRKGNRECRPSEGIVFRHQQNASMNNASTAATTGGAEEGSDIKHDENRRNGRGGSLKGFYSYKNTFNEDNVWLEIPKQGMSRSPRDL